MGARTVPLRPQLAKQRHTDRLGRSPGTPFRPSSWEEAGFLTASPQVGARKRQTFPEAISNRRCQSRPQPRATHDPLPGAPPGAPPHLSARHLQSPVKGGHPASGTPPQARPRGLAGQAGRGQGWGSGNPLPAPGEGQSQGLEQTKLPWSWGPGHRGPESPSSAAGRRFTGNVHKSLLEQADGAPQEGGGRGRRSPEVASASGWRPPPLERGPDSCLLRAGRLPRAHTSRWLFPGTTPSSPADVRPARAPVPPAPSAGEGRNRALPLGLDPYTLEGSRPGTGLGPSARDHTPHMPCAPGGSPHPKCAGPGPSRAPGPERTNSSPAGARTDRPFRSRPTPRALASRREEPVLGLLGARPRGSDRGFRPAHRPAWPEGPGPLGGTRGRFQGA